RSCRCSASRHRATWTAACGPPREARSSRASLRGGSALKTGLSSRIRMLGFSATYIRCSRPGRLAVGRGRIGRLRLAQFQFRAADAEGKVIEGTIEAGESAAVVARLQDRGLIPIRIGAVAAGKAATTTRETRLGRRRFIGRLGQRHLLIVTQEL